MNNRLTFREVRVKCARKADYPITHYLINPISNSLAWALQSSSVTPNQVTVFSLLLGAGASLCFFFASRDLLFLGAGLLFLSHIFDCLDGDIARLKGASSQFGAALDPICDRILEFLLFFGATLGLWRMSPDPHILLVGFYGYGTIAIYFYIVDAWLRTDKTKEKDRKFLVVVKDKIKFGLYEVILHGFVLAALLDKIEYMLYISAGMGTLGVLFQIFRLQRKLR